MARKLDPTWKLVGCIAACTMMIASFLPWITARVVFLGELSVAGTEGDGKITLAAGALALLAFLLGSRWAALPAVANIGVAVFTFANLRNAIEDWNAEQASDYGTVSVGYGLWVLVIAAVICVFATFTRSARPVQPVPWAPPNAQAQAL